VPNLPNDLINVPSFENFRIRAVDPAAEEWPSETKMLPSGAT
jgi:hypothetical protein